MKEGWAYKKLGEVCKTTSGGTPSKDHNEYYEGGTIPWLRSGEVSNRNITKTELFITQEGIDNSSAKLVPKNSVVIAMYGATVGQVGILKIEATTNQAVCSILPNDCFMPEFLYYVLLSHKKAYLELAVGGAQPNISQQIIKSTAIPVPPLETQSQIVNELDLLQSIIDKQKAQLKELDNLAQAVFYDMFGNPVENKKGWEVKKLEEIMSIPSRNGLTKPTAIRGTGVPMISMGELFANPIITEKNNASLVPVSERELELSQIVPGDLLFARQSLSLEGVGKCSLVESCLKPTVFESHLIRVRVDNSIALPRYVWCYFLSPHGRSEIQKRVYQVAAAGIKGSELIQIPIPIPPLVLQQTFVAKIESIEKQKTAIGKSLEETQKLFDYTMDKYFG